VVDYRYWVADGRRADFETIFGSDGIWQELLSRGAGYLATEVRCESVLERRYRVRDFWSWHRDFEIFRKRFAVEYAKFESLISAEGPVEREEFVGAYYEELPRGDKDSEGDELVPG